MSKDSVSLRDIYDAINNLEQKMDSKMDRLEVRVGSLENFKAQILIIGSLVLLAVTFLGDIVKRRIFGEA